MTGIEIVEEYLRKHGYDGLYNSDGECACLTEGLLPAPGDCGLAECEPGYKAPCDCGDHDFHVQEKKPE